MLGGISSTIHGVVDFTWPMIIISVIIAVSFRIAYIIKNHEKAVLYQELLKLSFLIYILCLFQVVTFQDQVNWSTNNFIPLREIFRYNIGSRLFFKNVLGNMIMFLPFGFFVSYYLKNDKAFSTVVLTVIASVSIEVVQMMIGRVFDVDDILLNLLGGIAGFYLYYLLDRIGNRLPRVLKSDIFLNILAIIILVGLVSLL